MKLQNQDIWLAYPKLKELSRVTFPVEVSLGLAKIISILQQPYALIEHERIKLVNQYGVENKETKQINVDPFLPQAGDFAVEFGGLLTKYWEEDIQIEKVKLPSKIEATCEECGHTMEVIFLIDPQTLMPLTEKFIE